MREKSVRQYKTPLSTLHSPLFERSERREEENGLTAMDVMAACRRACQACARLESMIDDLDDCATGVGGTGGGGTGGGGGAGDRMAAYMARKDELARRLKAEERWLAAGRQAVILLTANLPELPRKCLRAFYCYGENAPEIAQDEHYSASSVYKALAAGRAAMRMIPDKDAEEALPVFVRREWRDEE